MEINAPIAVSASNEPLFPNNCDVANDSSGNNQLVTRTRF